MNKKNTHSSTWKIVVERPEIPPPSLPGEVLAGVQVRGEPQQPETAQTASHEPPRPTPAKKSHKKWRNLTLDEMQSLLDDLKRQQVMTQ